MTGGWAGGGGIIYVTVGKSRGKGGGGPSRTLSASVRSRRDRKSWKSSTPTSMSQKANPDRKGSLGPHARSTSVRRSQKLGIRCQHRDRCRLRIWHCGWVCVAWLRVCRGVDVWPSPLKRISTACVEGYSSACTRRVVVGGLNLIHSSAKIETSRMEYSGRVPRYARLGMWNSGSCAKIEASRMEYSGRISSSSRLGMWNSGRCAKFETSRMGYSGRILSHSRPTVASKASPAGFS